MIVFALFFIFVAYLSAVPAWKLQSGRVNWNKWDYSVPLGGICLWIFLTAIGVGAQSLSNVIELFYVLGVTMAAPWVRVIFPGKNKTQSRLSSLIFSSLPLLAALGLRLLMPVLPE